MKKSQVGNAFYKDGEYSKAITVYVKEETHKALETQAKVEDRSLQKVVRRALEDYVSKLKATK